MTWASACTAEDNSFAADAAAFCAAPLSLLSEQAMAPSGAVLEAQGYLWVQLAPPGPQHRGRLGLYLEEAIEGALDQLGALAPGIQAVSGLEASLNDQLYRARLLERRGLALGIPDLEGIANLGRCLDADDSSVLRFWILAATQKQVRLLMSEKNTRLRVYPSPVSFQTLFDGTSAAVSPRAPSVEMAQAAATMALSELPPLAEELTESSPRASSREELEASGGELEPLDQLLPGVNEASAEAMSEELDGASAVETPDLAALSAAEDEVLPTWAPEAELSDLERALGLSAAPSQVRELKPQETHNSTQQQAPAAWQESPALPRASAVDPEEFLRALEEDSRRPPLSRMLSPRSPEQAKAEGPLAVKASQMAPAESQMAAQEELSVVPAEQLAVAPKPRLMGEIAPQSKAPALGAPELLVSPVGAASASQAPIQVASASQAPIQAASASQAAIQVASAPQAHEVLMTAATYPEVPELEAPEPSEASAAAPLPNRPPIRRGQNAPRPRLVRPEPAPVEAAESKDDPFTQLARRDWRSWLKNLEAARGPKPLAAVERMFVTDYTRLREAVRRKVADASATAVLDEWQAGFEESYRDAFDALRVRGKRPTMVLDVPELASRLARLQGAKRTVLLLVDGLRFDLGIMVQERLKARAEAVLAERLLLWSALPTLTTHQLELLGRGPEGLQENFQGDESPALVARGRAAETPRRIRTGRLELFKLDVVEDALREAGSPLLERLPDIAERTSVAVADFMSKLPPRTLVLLFGDHGFVTDPQKAGTAEEVRQGGASPEEVLVPAFGWLTGATH